MSLEIPPYIDPDGGYWDAGEQAYLEPLTLDRGAAQWGPSQNSPAGGSKRDTTFSVEMGEGSGSSEKGLVAGPSEEGRRRGSVPDKSIEGSENDHASENRRGRFQGLSTKIKAPFRGLVKVRVSEFEYKVKY